MSAIAEQIQDIAKLESGMATLAAKRKAALELLKAEINAAVVCWGKQFPEHHAPKTDGSIGVACAEFGYVENIADDEHLLQATLVGEVLEAYFEGPERSSDEPNGFQLRLPARYLGEGGEAAIVADARRLRDSC